MNAASNRMIPSRHPWLTRFESAPGEAFGELLAGYADIHPYERADAPDAARMLFGPLDPEDGARKVLGSAILSWLEKKRKEQLPAARPKLQRRVREICEAFEIVALLEVADAAVDLRQRLVLWNNWVARLVLSTARDARAEYWRMLGLTQRLVTDVEPTIDANGLAPMWQRICREAGGRLPRHYLSIGLLGLRRLPGINEISELPWVSGLAQWAHARQPSDSEFKAEWLALKPLYPRAPRHWRSLVARLLSAPTFKDSEINAPAWWHVDPDFAPMLRENFTVLGVSLRSPTPTDCDRVIAQLDGQFKDVEPLIDGLFEGHRRFLYSTGDSRYFVRAIHALGSKLIERGGDSSHARAQRAQAMAREGLKWRPYDPYLWSLWRDALTAEGALEAAELIGWEYVRRLPQNPDARTQLAILLVNSLGRIDDAESLLRETVDIFPESAVARNELAELLILENRIAEAESVLDTGLIEAKDAATFSARARIYSHQGRLRDALGIVERGLELYSSELVLRQYELRLKRGEKLSLKSGVFRANTLSQVKPGSTMHPDPEFAAVAQLGLMRRLRFRLDFGAEIERERALQDLRKVLRDEPAFAYAELLAARHRIWEAGADVLPSFAAAFEDALAAEDREKLEALALRQPRLEALVLVAQAILGDTEAERKVELWLRATQVADKEPVIAGLHMALRPILRVIEGGRSMRDAISEARETVVNMLHDANEATVGEMLLAA